MKRWAFALAAAAVSGCGSSAPGQGGVGQHCYPNGTCNSALSCFSDLCVNANVDGAAGTGGTGGVSVGGASGAGGLGGLAGNGAAGTRDGGTDASTFSVMSLPGLSLWLDAARGVTAPDGGGVSTWRDQAVDGNDAVANGAAPTLVASAINGLPAVELASSASTLGIQSANGTADLGFGTGPFLIEIVVKASGSMPALFTTHNGPASLTLGGDSGGHASATESGGFGVVSSNVTFGNGVPYLIGARRMASGASTTLELRIDGFVDGTMTGADYAQSLGNIAAAQLGGGGAADVAEVVVIKGAIAAGDLAALEAYFKIKYGL